MVNYVRAELYKVTHRKYTYWFVLVMLACAGLLVTGWVYSNTRGNQVSFYSAAGILVNLLSVGLYCTLLTGDLVFSDQYKFNTMKNEVSYGIPRVRIYLGKLAVSCVVALVACFLIIAFYLVACWLALPHNSATDGEIMAYVSFRVLSALPLWLGTQALAMLCLALIKSSTAASFAFVGVLMLLPEGLKLLGMLVHPVFFDVIPFLLNGLFQVEAVAGDWGYFARCFGVGAGWFAVTTALGCLSLRKREIS